MLGIRRVNGIALDLWSGNPFEFVADHLCEVAAVSDLDQFLHNSHSPLISAHFALAIGSELCSPGSSQALIRKVVELLSSDLASQRLRRLTLIIPDVGDYKVIQNALFAAIPNFEKD